MNPEIQAILVYQKSLDLVARRILNELILVPIRRKVAEVECLYVLNEVGACIWELIDGKRPVREICDAIVKEFAVNEAEAEADLLKLLAQLGEIGAITEVGRAEG
jgi:hypothetical protein